MPAPTLARKVLEEVIRHAAPSGGAFLVGGQALNLWAESYSAAAPELDSYGPYTSKDVDFFGTADRSPLRPHGRVRKLPALPQGPAPFRLLPEGRERCATTTLPVSLARTAYPRHLPAPRWRSTLQAPS